MEADELRLLPARQVLGFGAVGALALAFLSVSGGMPTAIPFGIAAIAMLFISSIVAPGRPRAFRAASVASIAAAAIWLLVPLVAPPGNNGAITIIALGAAAASAWSADFMYHEWRPLPRAEPATTDAARREADATANGEIVELDADDPR
jgi:hypothetical protein